MNRRCIVRQVSATLGDRPEDFDIDAIVDDIGDHSRVYGPIESIDDIDSDTYWEIVRKHDTTAV